MNTMSNFLLRCSLRQSVFGEEARWTRSRHTLCYESAEESVHRAKEKDSRTHHDGTPGARGRASVTLPRYFVLRLPNRRKTSPHPR